MDDSDKTLSGRVNNGRWTTLEHLAFIEGLRRSGREWRKVSALVPTRTVVQIRTHAQKYFQKLSKEHGHEAAELAFTTGAQLGVDMGTRVAEPEVDEIFAQYPDAVLAAKQSEQAMERLHRSAGKAGAPGSNATAAATAAAAAGAGTGSLSTGASSSSSSTRGEGTGRASKRRRGTASRSAEAASRPAARSSTRTRRSARVAQQEQAQHDDEDGGHGYDHDKGRGRGRGRGDDDDDDDDVGGDDGHYAGEPGRGYGATPASVASLAGGRHRGVHPGRGMPPSGQRYFGAAVPGNRRRLVHPGVGAPGHGGDGEYFHPAESARGDGHLSQIPPGGYGRIGGSVPPLLPPRAIAHVPRHAVAASSGYEGADHQRSVSWVPHSMPYGSRGPSPNPAASPSSVPPTPTTTNAALMLVQGKVNANIMGGRNTPRTRTTAQWLQSMARGNNPQPAAAQSSAPAGVSAPSAALAPQSAPVGAQSATSIGAGVAQQPAGPTTEAPASSAPSSSAPSSSALSASTDPAASAAVIPSASTTATATTTTTTTSSSSSRTSSVAPDPASANPWGAAALSQEREQQLRQKQQELAPPAEASAAADDPHSKGDDPDASAASTPPEPLTSQTEASH